jgi:ketosteroid isomerase-like protein
METRLTELYGKFSQGDLPGVLEMCTEDVTFEVPGRASISGTYTKDTFADLIGQVMRISNGTFGERPVIIVANDDHGIAVLDHWLERDGKRIEYRTDHIWQARDGKFCGWLERPGNQDEFDRVWS